MRKSFSLLLQQSMLKLASFPDILRHMHINIIRMKQLYLILIFLFTLSRGQSQPAERRDLTPSRAYYKELSAIDKNSRSANEEIDKQKFPFNPETAAKRLSLKPYFLQNVTAEDFKIPDPPANSSAQTRAELNYLLSLQQQRTRLDVESSLYMASVFYNVRTTPEDSNYHAYRQNLFHVGRSIGSWFNPKDLPLTADLIAHVWQDASYFIWSFKYKYLRIRPYVIDKDIKNLEDANWAAYPSGHAANSYVNAYIYQELAPEFTDTFIKDAYDMAHSRELIGVHYPSDSEASRILARQLVNKLFQNEKFLKDFQEVKKEWAAKAKESFVKPSIVMPADVKSSSSCTEKTTSACAKKCP
jgi:acid phosphatase (class A)